MEQNNKLLNVMVHAHIQALIIKKEKKILVNSFSIAINLFQEKLTIEYIKALTPRSMVSIVYVLDVR